MNIPTFSWYTSTVLQPESHRVPFVIEFVYSVIRTV